MLSPKRTKYRKPHRGRLKGKAMRGNKIAFGDFALQCLDMGYKAFKIHGWHEEDEKEEDL